MTMSFDDQQTWEEFASTVPRDATDTLRLIAAVYFRAEVEQNTSIDIAEIPGGYFRRARWARPINLWATANHCASRGWLAEVGRGKNRKVWKLTKTGSAAVRSSLGGKKGG